MENGKLRKPLRGLIFKCLHSEKFSLKPFSKGLRVPRAEVSAAASVGASQPSAERSPPETRTLARRRHAQALLGVNFKNSPADCFWKRGILAENAPYQRIA